MSDVDPQRDREANLSRRDLYLVSTGPARSDRLARSVRSPARAELGIIVAGAPDCRKHAAMLLMFSSYEGDFIQGVTKLVRG
jgi:hypothetical protein